MSRRRYMHGSRRHPSHKIGWDEHVDHNTEEEYQHMRIIRNGKKKIKK